MNSYEEFSDETKQFLNKAMDIYLTIKDIDIKKKFRRNFGEEYTLTKLDKKILSLYLAGFLVDGNLKDILEEYDDIKAKDVFSFIGINENDIKSLEDSEYNNFYDKFFKLDLISMMDEKSMFWKFNEITPEILYFFLSEIKINGSSRILNYLCEELDITLLYFYDHPSFKAVENFAISKGNMEKKEVSKGNNGFGLISPLFGLPTKSRNFSNPIEEENSHEKTKDKDIIDFEDEKIWLVLDDVQKKFIGQETAAEHLFYNIVNNQQLAMRDDVNDGERSIIFLDGPTGTGKTAITKEITSKLNIPFTSTSATNYSSTGYVGGNITDTLKELYKKADGDLEKAQRGIIVFDEFDKIAYSRSGGLEMKKAVQQQLLDFMGGGKYTINVGTGFFDSHEVEFDTSKLTFVCLGALSELRDVKTQKRQDIGFGGTTEIADTESYSITPQDLVSIGLERELVGRFNTYLHTEEYSRDDLLKILKESKISPMIGFKNLLASKGKKLQIEEGVYEVIADEAYKLNTGARSLQTIINSIRTHFLKKILTEKDEIIYLDVDTVINICENTTVRKVRK